MNLTDAGGTIVKEITIKGSAERIFEALTNPDQRVKWWGAEGRFQATQMESDLRPGGRWVMRGIGIGGKPFTVLGTYRTIERPHRLVFTWLPDWQEGATESVVRFDLEEKDGVTTLRLTHSGLTSEGARAHQGWPQILTWGQACVERRRPVRATLSSAPEQVGGEPLALSPGVSRARPAEKNAHRGAAPPGPAGPPPRHNASGPPTSAYQLPNGPRPLQSTSTGQVMRRPARR